LRTSAAKNPYLPASFPFAKGKEESLSRWRDSFPPARGKVGKGVLAAVMVELGTRARGRLNAGCIDIGHGIIAGGVFTREGYQ